MSSGIEHPMAKAEPEKSSASSSKMASILSHLSIALQILSLILLLVLFTGAFNLGVVDLRSTISGIAIIILPIFAVFALIAIFAQMKLTALKAATVHAKNAEIEALVNETKGVVEGKIQEYLGSEYERLKGEHEKMSEFLKELEKQEQERLAQELEELKAENSELKERLSMKNVPINDELSAVDELAPTGT